MALASVPAMRDPLTLPTWNQDGLLHVVVEAPAGSHHKLAYAPELGCFTVSRHLAKGLHYPHDWGFVPGTRAEDGDPLDALVMAEAGTHPGVVHTCVPIAVVRLSQRHHGSRQRNDRIIALPAYQSPLDDEEVDELRGELKRKEIERFLLEATAFEGKGARIDGWGGAKEARKAIDRCVIGKAR
jgi:inorganic pyrophosphatase